MRLRERRPQMLHLPRRRAKRTPQRTNTIPSGTGSKVVRVSFEWQGRARIYPDLAHIDWSRFLLCQYPSSPSLVAAYASLKGALAAPDVDLLSCASRLSDAILRALDTVHLFLFSPPNPSPDAQIQLAIGTPLQLKPEHIDSTRIALVSPLLMYVLRTALHTLVRIAQDITKSKRPRPRPRTTTPATADAHAYVDRVLDHLLECVLLPLLRAITALCSARLAPLVSAPLKKDNKTGRTVGKGKDRGQRTSSASAAVDPPKKTDVRTDVFALIGTSLGALDAIPLLARPTCPGASADGIGIASGVRDRLGLETIRELEALYVIPPLPPRSPAAPPSSLPPSSQAPPTTPLEPPPLSLSAPSPSLSQPRSRTTQSRALTESSRAQRLERLAGTRAERVRALATRDAGWFLASTLSLCVAAGRGGGTGGLLRKALLDRIGRLVQSVPVGAGLNVSDGPGQQPGNPSASDALHEAHAVVHRNATDPNKFTLDPVCQNMLLAICERAMSDLLSS